MQKLLSLPQATEVMLDIHFNWWDTTNTKFIPNGIRVNKKNNEIMLTY
jgi:hypothetical protein